jgi:hypothetical protein
MRRAGEAAYQGENSNSVSALAPYTPQPRRTSEQDAHRTSEREITFLLPLGDPICIRLATDGRSSHTGIFGGYCPTATVSTSRTAGSEGTCYRWLFFCRFAK